MVLEQKLSPYILVPKHDQRENTLEMALTFLNYKSQQETSSNKATAPNPSQAVPQAEVQAYKYKSLGGPFLFTPPQYRTQILLLCGKNFIN